MMDGNITIYDFGETIPLQQHCGVLPDLMDRFRAMNQTPTQDNSNKQYHIGQNVKLTSTTGATVEGRLGGVDGERGAFYVGARLYSPSRFREKVDIQKDPDDPQHYYLEVSI